MGKHTEWRKLVKKARRKRIRREIAKFRKNNEDEEEKQREQSPTYKQWLKDQRQTEIFQAAEEVRLAKEAEYHFLEREKEAQIKWEELQIKLILAKEERTRQIAKIKEEWDREQKKLKDLKEKKEQEEEDKRREQEILQLRIEEFVTSNAEMPNELTVMLESNPGKMVCPFFKKTAACRFNDTCSRNHIRPTISRILLFRNFYSHYSLEQTAENEYGSDSILEFESKEIDKHFKEFFHDVLHEMEIYGEIKQFKVCCNRESHLRGNVYIEYSNCRQAIKSYRVFQGRWYGGKQINVEFCNIESWKSAICGLFFRQRCPKGSVCNFLHVFRNPENMFINADRDLHHISQRNYENCDRVSTREWRWSESPERINIEHSRESNSRDYSKISSNEFEDHENKSSPRLKNCTKTKRHRFRERRKDTNRLESYDRYKNDIKPRRDDRSIDGNMSKSKEFSQTRSRRSSSSNRKSRSRRS